ncbi:hypothetical protein ABZ801_11090 [Actinomadura sp. NPDC047616]|uniref:hypothetical protein n=1 Tax=Actinomadura sp. NPDC047616 TaxID=3155914 RepID=UPI0033C0336A
MRDTYPRVPALNKCDLGELHAARGDIESVGSWADAVQLLRGVDAARAPNAVRPVRTALSFSWQRGIIDANQSRRRSGRCGGLTLDEQRQQQQAVPPLGAARCHGPASRRR